jgi:hypothetical protein
MLAALELKQLALLALVLKTLALQVLLEQRVTQEQQVILASLVKLALLVIRE